MKILQILLLILGIGVVIFLGKNIFQRFKDNKVLVEEINSLGDTLYKSLETYRFTPAGGSDNVTQPAEEEQPQQEIAAPQEEPQEEIDNIIEDANEIKRIFRSQLSIEQTQEALKKAGFYMGPVDGKLYELLKKAIVQFQMSSGLNHDGIIGKNTSRALEQYMEKESSQAQGAEVEE